MNHLVSPFWQRLFVLAVAAGICSGAASLVERTEWNKERYYRRLIAGHARQQALAAGRLAELGGQAQLVRALHAETAEVRGAASEALWQLWIKSAGEETYRLVLQADAAAAEKRYDEALRILDLVVENHPDFAEGWNRRAIIHWQTQRYRRSIKDWQRAVALNPYHFGAWHGLALCQIHLGNLLDARWSLQAVLQITPHDEHARQFLRACDELLHRLQPSPDRMMEQA